MKYLYPIMGLTILGVGAFAVAYAMSLLLRQLGMI